jgi:hypothetical protein
VNGNGFAANTMVRILFNGSSGTQVGSPTSDGSGNFSTSVTIPSVTVGTYQVVATDGSNSATTSFTVTMSFSLSLSPSSGGTGTGVNVSGAGFGANEGVVIGWDQPGNQVTTATTNGSGGFTASFTVPSSSGGGNHSVFATGQSSHLVVTRTFTVNGSGNVGGANLSLSPASGAAGSTVSLNGTGFNGSEQVNLAVDGGVVTSVTSDGSGNFATTLQLSSSLSGGSHTISATATSSGHSATVTFFVTNQNQRGRQAVSGACSSGDERHGNGFGDDNHCHTGSQGHHNDQGHGDGNDQGEDD